MGVIPVQDVLATPSDAFPQTLDARVLILDDDAYSTARVERILKRCGAQVEWAQNVSVAQAMTHAHATDIDVVIVDTLVSDEVAERMHVWLEEHYPEKGFLAIDGLSSRAQTVQPYATVKKPFTAAELVERLHAVLDATDE